MYEEETECVFPEEHVDEALNSELFTGLTRISHFLHNHHIHLGLICICSWGFKRMLICNIYLRMG